MRLGRIEVNFGYVVDLDDEEMVDHAKEAIREDIVVSVPPFDILHGKREEETFKKDEIEEFLLDKGDDDEFMPEGSEGCDEKCAEHAEGCDGYCDHFSDHSNGCMK